MLPLAVADWVERNRAHRAGETNKDVEGTVVVKIVRMKLFVSTALLDLHNTE